MKKGSQYVRNANSCWRECAAAVAVMWSFGQRWGRIFVPERNGKFMTKREFLDTLRLALNGKVTSGQLAENLEYYEDYINTETRKGRDEGEVLAELGDPRLIARTIVETGGGSHKGGQTSAYGDESRWYGGPGNEGYQPDGPTGRRQVGLWARIPLGVWLILGILVVILVLSAVFSVISALLPILLPILGVLLLVKLFRDWIN